MPFPFTLTINVSFLSHISFIEIRVPIYVSSECQIQLNLSLTCQIQEYYGGFCQHAVYNIQTRIAFQNPNATIPDGGLGGSPVWPAVVIVLSSSGVHSYIMC
jgi:hypothetical protein